MRVLLVQQTIDPPGGGNAIAAWMLEALAGVHQPATLTMGRWHPEVVDRYYGTSLSRAAVPQRYPPVIWRFVHRLPWRLTRLRMAILMRAVRRHVDDFDLLVTADNYVAFGRRGIQYVHYPAPLRPEPPRFRALVHLYYRACDVLSGLSWEAARLNETLANSQWTSASLRNYGIEARLLYPPVVDPGPGHSWAERANTFLCIGRFDPYKRFELAVSILSRVRAFLPDARLHIIGSRTDKAYTRRLSAMAEQWPDWIAIDEDLPQDRLFALMRGSRYGIHAMESEHFGIAVAEMARAGCVPFVHDSGGQVEAIGGVPALRWRTPDEAVARIRAVAESDRLQQHLSATLREHAERFSTARFVHEFREIVGRHGAAMDRNPGSRRSSA